MPIKPPAHKVYTRSSLQNICSEWQKQKQKVVFTNGCFDLIHKGHILYLHEAAQLGDKLIVGVNSDASVKQLKGPERPVKDEETRALLLASLYFVDAVVVFPEETPYELIKAINPDVLVKGGDWRPEEIVGADIVMGKGGQVFSLSLVEGQSSTRLVEKIRSSR